ncbi:hypothetical protein POTOM_015940 [Populus tomentosa]|uniref:Helicase C-terminal domain-containing protein n=1 Tax=Populus tomentosa TaxID=118781 RepID=A0A8X7ZYI3_POPTO|nr:hypothetical protein POTOM_015940 [Populus tomentosa]
MSESLSHLTGSYAREPKNIQDRESADLTPFDAKLPGNKLMETEISVHPKHRKKMKAHQVEVFKFLCSNLLADDPGGCILAHAPGSGKKFMVISFIKSFPAKNPDGRPLVVMPKGILATWKKEFVTWQAEDIPLIDFYSSKADKRSQQLDVLEQWVKQRSILFLGYKQFSVTVSDNVSNKVAADCKDVLLKVPTLLILDDGHLPINEEIEIPKMRSHTGTDSAFFDLVEYTLQNDEDLRTRKAVIQNLRSALYMHPKLKCFLEKYPASGERGLAGDDSTGEKLLVFSQYIMPLRLLERLSAKIKGWSPGKELFIIKGGSNAGNRERCMERFNGSPDAKVFFGSIKACGEGISLVGASRIIISDVHPKPPVTRQAIGRAFRPGREKKWNDYFGDQEFEAKTVDVNECDDVFFDSPGLREDLKVLYKRQVLGEGRKNHWYRFKQLIFHLTHSSSFLESSITNPHSTWETNVESGKHGELVEDAVDLITIKSA